MKLDVFRNLFAAVGAAFFLLLLIVLLLAHFSGGRKFSNSDKVAVVKLEGVITDPTEIDEQLREVSERDDVKAVVLRINSPGGAVGPSQEIYGEVQKLRKSKVVVASMGAVAASGGYYVAVAANKIVANPGTITGSIGVIVEFVNAEELLGKLGIKGYVVKSGQFKDTGSPLRGMTDAERKYLQALVNDVNGQFVRAVADGRNLKVEDVEKIADGRIFTGAQAKELGLIDSLGGLTDSIDLSAGLAGLKGKPVIIYFEKKGFGWLRTLVDESIARGISNLTGLRIMYLTANPAM